MARSYSALEISSCESTLVIGPSQSGKTTIALTVAGALVKSAIISAQKGDVWFICNKNKIDDYQPSKEVALFDGELDRIQMKYMERIADLKWWTLHIQELFQNNETLNFSSPLCVIIDDFDIFMEEENFQSEEEVQRSIMSVIALLKLSIDYFNSKLSCTTDETQNHKCSFMICVNDDSEKYKIISNILERGVSRNVLKTSDFVFC
mmetsp:Transcript_25599/g.33322  ORF Transcript_25599/g.33322 Transcript_25599/m.33322 type:complete len:206 (-) Transcript_25599:252-869(-)